MDETPAYFTVYSRIGLRGRRWRWTLSAPNGEVIAVSQSYRSPGAAYGGIDAVGQHAPGADIRTAL